jgi:hypothetical protein
LQAGEVETGRASDEMKIVKKSNVGVVNEQRQAATAKLPKPGKSRKSESRCSESLVMSLVMEDVGIFNGHLV